LPSFVVERLRRHRREQAERRLFIGGAWHDADLICDRGDGQHLDPDGFSHAFERFVERAGLPPMRLHDLRHAHATTLLAAGVHPKVVSEALGHASVAFTMDTYQHVLPTMGGQVATAIEVAVGGLSQ
jgi:integrase